MTDREKRIAKTRKGIVHCCDGMIRENENHQKTYLKLKKIEKERNEYIADRDKWLAKAVRLKEDFRVMREIAFEWAVKSYRYKGQDKEVLQRYYEMIDQEFARRRGK